MKRRSSLRCPPMTLLTLVENAVRHGIDPSEEGGRIEIYVQAARRPLRACASATPARACGRRAAGSAPASRRCASAFS